MNISQKGLNLIKIHEGYRARRYLCAAGIPTIGYGHALKNGENYTEITESKAEELLKQDVQIAESTVNSSVIIKLSQNQFDALVSLVYNWGTGNFLKSDFLKKLNSLKYEEVVIGFRSIIKGNGKILPGLVRRREEEIKLFLTQEVDTTSATNTALG